MMILEQWLPNVMTSLDDIWEATVETLYMSFVTCIVAYLIGLVVGIILAIWMPGGLKANRVAYSILDKLVNIFRSIPFIILIALLVGITRLIVGTSIGTTAVIVPLVVCTIPFYARQVQNVLVEVDPGIIEAAEAMGLTTNEIIFQVMLKESIPSLIRMSALTFVSVVSYTAMAGTVGGGGLGDLAIVRGYERHQMDVTFVCTAIILVIVFLIQGLADWYASRQEH
ncbi:MAG: methionine ABC transporter permease [Aerococcus sp.]|nr:methionine ABC transporter permease [Aerococcus sp.]